MSSQQTPSEFIESLTGFEEIAIERHISDFDIYADAERKSIRAIRALIFTDRVRQGDSPAEAKKHAFELPFKAVEGYFASEDPTDDLDPEDPDTAAGKDDAQLD